MKRKFVQIINRGGFQYALYEVQDGMKFRLVAEPIEFPEVEVTWEGPKPEKPHRYDPDKVQAELDEAMRRFKR